MSLRKKFLHYVLPTIVTMWVFTIYTMVDGVFVGRGVGPVALGAVNIAMPFINMIFAASMLFGAGASTVIAILFGRGEGREANQIFTLNTLVVLLLAAVISVVTLLNLEQVSRFLGATEVNVQYVISYLKFVIPFAGCFMVSYVFEILVKTDGFPKLATVSISVGAAANIFLDYLFVLVFHWGIEGAAIATGISQLSSTLIFLAHFLGKHSRLKFVKPQPDFSVYRRILPLGLSNAVTELSIGVVTFIFNHMILKVIGEDGIVSFTIITYVNSLVMMTMFAVAQGSQPLVSYYYGHEERGKCHSLLKLGVAAIAVCSALAFLFCQVFPGLLVSAFIGNKNPELYASSVWALRLYSISFLFLGWNILLSGFFGSIEQPRNAMIISCARGFILISISLVVLAALFQSAGIWLAAAVSELLCLGLSLSIFFRYWNSLPCNLKICAPCQTTEESFIS